MNHNPDDKFRIFALTASGKRISFQIPIKEGLDVLEESHAILSKEGFTDDELRNLILSPTELEELPPVATETRRVRALSVEALESSSSLPPIPRPTNKDDLPPQKSSEIIISKKKIDLFVRVPAWGHKNRVWVPVRWHGRPMTAPPIPTPAQIVHKRYWLNTFSEFITGPQEYKKTITTKKGMSKTNSATLSGELGISIGDLSAKLSKISTESITINEEYSETNEHKITVDKGKICIYTLWTLIDEFVFVDKANKPIEWKGRQAVGPGPKTVFKFENHFTNKSHQYSTRADFDA